MSETSDLIEDASYRALIGLLIVRFAQADHALTRLAWRLIDFDDRRAAQIIVDRTSSAQVQALVGALLPHRFPDAALSSSLKDALDSFARLRDLRNGIGHADSIGTLGQHPEKPNEGVLLGLSLIRPPDRKNPNYRGVPSPIEMQESADEAARLANQFDAIQARYIGAVIEKRKATLATSTH